MVNLLKIPSSSKLFSPFNWQKLGNVKHVKKHWKRFKHGCQVV